MKALLISTIILSISVTSLFAIDDAGDEVKARYGLAASYIYTGTGHGAGYTVNANVTKGRKLLEAGIIYSERESKISGADIKYRIYLGALDRLNSGNKIFNAYLQYNLVYQKGTSYSPELVTLGDQTYLVNTDPGTIATMGHFIAYGNQVSVMKNLYFDTSLGLGYYIGSLDKVDGPGTWGIHNENSGFTYSFKIGFGYMF
ncbi:MAG: hypothetical protein JXB24_12075 [Bacteroidales bacterium]|nr:hypothetical protein [Bacteroidales bacterium]